MSSTFEALSQFSGGERIIKKHDGVDVLCDRLDDLKPADLTTILMFSSARKAAAAKPSDIIEGSHFSSPSPINPRDLHIAQGFIFENLDGIDFVDLAPLQPEGTSYVLAGTNQKNIMPALRHNEVNSDAATSLFREVYKRSKELDHSQDIRLATNARITRVQHFDPKTGFLPHFSMFAQVSIGKEGCQHGESELDTIATHLRSEVSILEAVGSYSGRVSDIDIQIGNLLFTEDIIRRFNIDRSEVRKRTQDPDFDLLEHADGIEIPDDLALGSETLLGDLREAGFSRGVGILEKFIRQLEVVDIELLERVRLDLGRVAGIGYYNNLCYKVHVTNDNGTKLPLVDGGTTDWVQKIDPRLKRYYTMGSGIGTELLVLQFM